MGHSAQRLPILRRAARWSSPPPLLLSALVLTLFSSSSFFSAEGRPPPAPPPRALYDEEAPVLRKLELKAPALTTGGVPKWKTAGLPLLDVKDGPQDLVYTFEVEDDLSGIDVVSVMSTGRAGNDRGWSVETYQPDRGNQTSDGRWLWGVYTKSQTYPPLSATGSWQVNWVKLTDNMGNMRVYDNKALRAMGVEMAAVDFEVDSENCEAYPWQCSRWDELQEQTHTGASDYRPDGLQLRTQLLAELTAVNASYMAVPDYPTPTFDAQRATYTAEMARLQNLLDEDHRYSAGINIAAYYQSYVERSYPEIFQYFQLKKTTHLDGYQCTWQESSEPEDPSRLC